MSDLVELLLGPFRILTAKRYEIANEITRLRGQVEEGERRIGALTERVTVYQDEVASLGRAIDEIEAERDTATLALSDLRAALIHARYVIYGLMAEDQPGVSEEELHRQYPLQFDPINAALSQAVTADKEGE